MDEPMYIEDSDLIELNAPFEDRPPTPRELLTNLDGLVNVQYAQDAMARMLLDSSRSFRHGGHNSTWVSAASGEVPTRCQGDPSLSKDDVESSFEEKDGWRRLRM